MNFYLFLTLFSICAQKSLCQSLPNGCQDAFKTAALNVHNAYRAKHGSPPLVELSSIDSMALAWSQNLAKNNIFQHSGTKGVGENLYAVYGGSLSSSSQCASNKFYDLKCEIF